MKRESEGSGQSLPKEEADVRKRRLNATSSTASAIRTNDDRQLFRGNPSVSAFFYFHNLFYLKQVTQPVFALVVFFDLCFFVLV